MGDVQTAPLWFGAADGPLCGWLTTSGSATRADGVVIVPPLGYEQLTAHRALRALAERLAADGHAVLRYDHRGTGDSAGDLWAPGLVADWRADVHAAVRVLRDAGCERVTLVGLRLGALLALLEGADAGADAVVAWTPPASGKRYVRELKLLGDEIPEEHDRGLGPALAQAGDVYTAGTLAGLAALPAPAQRPAPRILVVDGSPGRLAAALTELGATVQTGEADGTELAIGTTAELGGAPAPLIERIARWVGPAAGRPPTPVVEHPRSTTMTWEGETIRETVVHLGPHALVGVATDPLSPDPDAATIVFHNPGSEPHFGPGRAWVQFARDLALRGHRAVRVDFRGWGDSPDDDKAPGRPYDEHGLDDAHAVVAALREAGHSHVVPFGLCAGAFIALKLAATENPGIAGAIALNPQMYWNRSMPNQLTFDESVTWLEPVRARWRRGQRRHEWTLLDVLGHRDAAGAWLDRLARAAAPTTLIFAEGDEGVFHLRVRLARRLAAAQRSGNVRLVEVPDIDHSMYRLWRRPAVLEAIAAALEGRLSAS